MSSAKEGFLQANTLAGLVGQCRGHITTLELRNEGFVTGKVVDVDGFFNISMEKVKFTDPSGNRRTFDSFFVQSRLIRFVQIPSRLDLRKLLQKAAHSNSRVESSTMISKSRQNILKKREERDRQDRLRAVILKTNQ